MQLMTPAEKRAYDYWNNGTPLPKLDRETMRKELPGNPSYDRLRLVEDRTEALRRLYDDPTLEMEHYQHVQDEMVWMMPLIHAMTKIVRQERVALTEGGQLSLSERQQLAACQQLLRRIRTAKNDLAQEWNKKIEEINYQETLLNSRIKMLESKR